MASADAPAPVRNPFPFQHKSNTLDRDRIVVPAGWDSWGKITVMREFDPKMWGEAWERDVDEESIPEDIGAKKLFSALVSDHSTKVSQPNPNLRAPADTLESASAVTAVQQSNTRTSLPRQELRRKLQKARSRSSWRIPESRRSRGCSSRNCGSVGTE